MQRVSLHVPSTQQPDNIRPKCLVVVTSQQSSVGTIRVVIAIIDNTPTAGGSVIIVLAFLVFILMIPTTVVIENVCSRRDVIPHIQSFILVFAPRSQSPFWAVRLILRLLRFLFLNTLLGFLANQISPHVGSRMEFAPQFRKVLNIPNAIGDDVVPNWALFEYLVGISKFSLEQSPSFLFCQLPAR